MFRIMNDLDGCLMDLTKKHNIICSLVRKSWKEAEGEVSTNVSCSRVCSTLLKINLPLQHSRSLSRVPCYRHVGCLLVHSSIATVCVWYVPSRVLVLNSHYLLIACLSQFSNDDSGNKRLLMSFVAWNLTNGYAP